MSQDPEARHAEELEALLRELQAGHLPSTPDHAPEADTAFVAALVQLSHEIEPASNFAAELEERLRARTPAGAVSAAGTAGSPGGPPRRRTPAPLGRPRAWRRWMSLAAMVLLALLLLTPQVRAGVGNVIRIGAVRIGLAPAGSGVPTPPYSGPVPTPLSSLLDLAGATTLDQARTHAGFPVRLPAYPPDLGLPQYVFLQNLAGPAVALVWVDPAHSSTVRLALFELSSDVYIYKSGATTVTETTVNGQRALWTQGPYVVQVVENGQVAYATRVLVNGYALIWTDGSITYRLETTASLNEAVKIAESLH